MPTERVLYLNKTQALKDETVPKHINQNLSRLRQMIWLRGALKHSIRELDGIKSSICSSLQFKLV